MIFNPSASTHCQSSSDDQSHAISPIRSRTIHSGSCASDTFWPYDVLKSRSASSRGEEHCGIQLPGDGRQAIQAASPIHFTTCSSTNSTSSSISTFSCYHPSAHDGPTTTTVFTKLLTQISIPSSSNSVQAPRQASGVHPSQSPSTIYSSPHEIITTENYIPRPIPSSARLSTS